jgi:hypothetical protein
VGFRSEVMIGGSGETWRCVLFGGPGFGILEVLGEVHKSEGMH